ncbi:MAG: BatD family protein [Sulfuriflexus sp.]|nr:BatD family protein [Sulfuriflexus sp.]
MVKLISLILLFIAPFAYSDSSLRIIADNPTVEIGKPLHITITAKNIDKNLASINIERLEENFGVYVIESSNKSENNIKIQELEIALYPHNIGKDNIPPITLGRHKSLTVPITILAAKENKQTLKFSSSISSSSIWQRQQIIMTAHVITHSKFANIKLDDFIEEGFESSKLEPVREELGSGMYRLTSGWLIYPLVAGKKNITFPAVNYRLKGKVQRKFIPSNIQLNIRELPSYIPPLMPVGEIIIESNITTGSDNPDKSHTVTVNISSDSALPSTLPNLPQNYILESTIHIGETSSNIINVEKNNSSNTSIHHRLPISFTSSGIYHFPALTLKYFDVESGRIITATGKPITGLILLPWLKASLLIIAIIILAKIIVIANKMIRDFSQLRKRRKHIITATLTAKSPHELHQLLNKYANTYNWGNNMTLSSWLISWEKSRHSTAKVLIDRLSAACYSGEIPPNLNQDIFLLLSSK